MKKAIALFVLLAPLAANAGVIRYSAKKSYKAGKFVGKHAAHAAKYVAKKGY